MCVCVCKPKKMWKGNWGIGIITGLNCYDKFKPQQVVDKIG